VPTVCLGFWGTDPAANCILSASGAPTPLHHGNFLGFWGTDPAAHCFCSLMKQPAQCGRALYS
jgi:hypothetical protein